MYFKYQFVYKCLGCGWRYSKLGSGEKGDNPPTLDGGPRTLHSEMGEKTQYYDEKTNRLLTVPVSCHGVLMYQSTTVILDRVADLLSKASYKCVMDNLDDNKQAYEKALGDYWKSLQAKGKIDATMSIPDTLWSDLREAHLQRKKQLKAQQPQTAWDAVALAVQYGANVEGRTLCVAFNNASKRFKAGSSAGKYTKIWSRGNSGTVTCSNADPRLQPLTDALNGVTKKSALGREVWVCAEIDATAKALLEGWNISDLRWACKEYQDKGWRDIKACGHCTQWADY